MSLVRTGRRIWVHDPRRGGCGDCPGLLPGPAPVGTPFPALAWPNPAYTMWRPPWITGPMPPAVPATPIVPPFTEVRSMFILEGFEHPATFVDGTWAPRGLYVFPGSAACALTPNVRAGGTTTLQALEVVYDPTQGGLIQWTKSSDPNTAQYFRAYVQIVSFTNGHGSFAAPHGFGFTDSTGFRYNVTLNFPAGGGLGPFRLDCGVLGTSATGTFVPSVGAWYRMELLSESLASGVMTTLFLYDGDTMILLDHVQMFTGGLAMGGYPFVGPGGTAGAGNALRLRFDDIRIETSAPPRPTVATQGPLYGRGGIWSMYPAGVSQSEWTPVGVGVNYQGVGEFPPAVFDEDTGYVQSAGTAALADFYTVAPFPTPLPAGVITAILVNGRTRLVSGAGATKVSVLYRDPSGTSWEGYQQPVRDAGYTDYPLGQAGGVDPKPSRMALYYRPVPLDTANVSQQAIGVRRIAGGTAGEVIHCTSVWMNMDVVVA